MPIFSPNVPNLLNIDSTDPFCTIRLLQRIYTNVLDYVSTNATDFTTGILDRASSQTGGRANDFTQLVIQLQK